MAIQQLTSNNFDEFLNKDSDRVIQFYSKTCVLCRLNEQILVENEERLNIDLGLVCGNTEIELVKRYEISHAPTVFVIPKGGEMVRLPDGLQGKQLLDAIKEVLGRES